MTSQLLLSAAFSLLGVAYYLLRRFWIENQRLRKARSRTAAILWNLKRQRDAYAASLELAGDEFEELHERCVELEGELAEFRKDDVRRVVQERVWS